MTKSLTEQWREGKLPEGWYYCQCYDEIKKLYCGDGESLELDDPETSSYYFFHRENGKGQVEVLAPVPSYDEWQAELDSNNELLNVQKRLEKRLVSNSDELVQKIHILNEQNTKQYNELCEEIKKNNILEKRLEISTKALKKIIRDYEINGIGYLCVTRAREALKEMEGVK